MAGLFMGLSGCFVIFPGRGCRRCALAPVSGAGATQPCPARRQQHLFGASALPLHLFAFPSSQPVHQVHPLVMTISLVAILSSARNIPNPAPLRDSRCKHHLCFPFSCFFIPIILASSVHYILFCFIFFPHCLMAKDRSS